MLALFAQAQGPVGSRAAQRERARQQAAAEEAAARAARDIAEMRDAVEGMASEMRLLRRELAVRAASDRRVRDIAQLLQVEESLARLKREQAETRARLRAAHAREDSARLRLANIENEIIGAGGVNRDETERVIREAIDRQINDAVAEQQAHERDVERLQESIDLAEAQAARARARLQELADEEPAVPDAEPAAVDREPPPADDADGVEPGNGEPPPDGTEP
jgi:hypothetical protein